MSTLRIRSEVVNWLTMSNPNARLTFNSGSDSRGASPAPMANGAPGKAAFRAQQEQKQFDQEALDRFAEPLNHYFLMSKWALPKTE